MANKKQILGLGGLALVTAMTAYATTIPVPDANAVSAQGNTEVIVQVYALDTSIVINTPADGTTTKDSIINLSETYSNSGEISNTVSINGKDIYLGHTTFEKSSNGQYSEELNLKALGGYGDYILNAKSTNYDKTSTDSSSFTYQPIIVSENKDGDTIIDYDDNVTHIDIDVYDPDGNKVTTISYDVDNSGTSGTVNVTDLLTDAGLEAGDYTIETTASGPTATSTVKDTTTDETNKKITTTVEWDDNTSEIYFLVTDGNGNTIALPDQKYTVENPGTAGSATVTLDLTNVDLPDGWDWSNITVSTLTYAIPGSTKNLTTYYTTTSKVSVSLSVPNTNSNKSNSKVKVPDTGSIFSVFGLSKADLLITSLFVFIIAVIAAFIIMKKSTSASRRR